MNASPAAAHSAPRRESAREHPPRDRPPAGRAAGALALLAALALSPAWAQTAAPAAAASGPAAAEAAADADADNPPVNDRFEGFNRGMFAFNEAVDNVVLKPVAKGYRAVTPEIVRTWVSNFFGNIGDAWTTVNLALQGKPHDTLEMTMRVVTNSTLGLAGLLDIATEAGLQRRDEDFGQTLGYWGVPSGPYLVLPLLGPSQVRETAALPLDRGVSAALLFHGGWDRAGITVLDVVSARTNLLGATDTLDSIALDKYSFVRDAYVQRRESLVNDGETAAPSASSPGR